MLIFGFILLILFIILVGFILARYGILAGFCSLLSTMFLLFSLASRTASFQETVEALFEKQSSFVDFCISGNRFNYHRNTDQQFVFHCVPTTKKDFE